MKLSKATYMSTGSMSNMVKEMGCKSKTTLICHHTMPGAAGEEAGLGQDAPGLAPEVLKLVPSFPLD